MFALPFSAWSTTMRPMFFTLAILSLLGYSLQTILLYPYAKKMDGLSLAVYRNASFAITLLPLLLGASWSDLARVLTQWQLLAATALAGGWYLGFLYAAYRYLPLGITSAILRASFTIITVMVGWTLLGEILHAAELVLILVVLIATLFLGWRGKKSATVGTRAAIGVVIALVAAIPLAVTNYTLAILSRNASPLVASYVWEAVIALGGLMLVLGRRLVAGKGIERISLRQFGNIALRSSPTLIGTVCLAFAIRLGPLAIANVILTLSLAVMALAGWWFYGERLTRVQWGAIVVLMAAIGGLKFVE